MGDLIEDLFAHHRWANLTLIDSMEQLSDEQLRHGGEGVYGAALDTLVHLLAAEGRYINLLTGRFPEKAVREGDRPPFALLREVGAGNADTLAVVARDLKQDQVVRSRYQGQQYENEVSLILLQAINHGTEHRSQIKAVLTQAGVQPPELDGWSFSEAAGRLRIVKEA
jgi:uncharacterized damage-inducible protein DinB